MLIVLLVLLIALLVWFAMKGRAWMKTTAWGQRFLAWVEPIEIALYKKSETLLVSRALAVGGFVVTAYDWLAVFASSLDMTPITSRLLWFVPEDMRVIAMMSIVGLIGLLMEWLRKRVTKPVEVVAVSDKVMEQPGVQSAVVMAEAANAQAVAVVTEAKEAAA